MPQKQKLKTVYRLGKVVEKKFVGVYRCTFTQDKLNIYSFLNIDSFGNKKHPGPYTDFGEDIYTLEARIKAKDSNFGFPSRKAFQYWFNKKQRKKLEKDGVVLKVMRIKEDKIISSKKQCLYDPKAVVKERIVKVSK